MEKLSNDVLESVFVGVISRVRKGSIGAAERMSRNEQTKKKKCGK